jgi:phosphatidylglycerophosphate synthase
MNENSNTSSKVPKYLDNPIDVWICEIGEKLDPYFVKMNMTPNKLTTINGYFGLLSAYFLYNKIKYLPGIFFFIAYMFDCFDGQFARKHNMTSNIGAYYDIIKDWIVILLISYVLYKRKKMYLSLFTIVLYSCGPHLGCQEHYYRQHNPDKIHSELLSLCRYFCPFNNTKKNNTLLENTMKYTRYFGTGTANLLASLVLFFV